MKYKAFTLAEVLITIGVIGVVAAITLHTVIIKIQNYQLEVAFKKSYSTLSQAINMYQADNGELLSAENIYNGLIHGGPEHIKNIFKKYIEEGAKIDKSKIGGYKNYPNNYGINSYYTINTYANYVMKDGSFLYIVLDYGKKDVQMLNVDVNGYKKPNRAGYDLFSFYIDKYGKLLPMGDANSIIKNCNKTVVSSDNGLGCTIKALQEKDYFKNLSR